MCRTIAFWILKDYEEIAAYFEKQGLHNPMDVEIVPEYVLIRYERITL